MKAFEALQGIDQPQHDLPRPEFVIPSIVCIAFAVELGLKALLYREARPIQKGKSGHSLVALASEIPNDVRVRLVATLGIDDARFSEALAFDDRSFEKWRYAHEFDEGISADNEFLHRLAKALITEVVTSAVPE
ncbi:hypothetical protein ABXN37_08700 [Piscinibacter sakaiensis]|uniref:hypothetical protein n=1 Tax=Piscinibacter sakaiensis TaxID=1547922 RepID=UPI0006B47440|nr:hypothetical protein [Piscinibacter sakaiensis]